MKKEDYIKFHLEFAVSCIVKSVFIKFYEEILVKNLYWWFGDRVDCFNY